ncbi:MAG: adenylate/guanylate cyclase domain-containing protein [Verrucomicrobiae bacterium]|nr:adenylate/guanylate cyclase domain-containing protein [Verrucomicrobiae bacterium]
MNLTSSLKSDPWKQIWGRKEQAVHLSWSTDLRSDPEELWPLLSNTSELNARLGLPEMEFEERDGNLYGSVGSGLFRQEWVEAPWQWEAGKSLSAERRYSKGFAHAVRVRYLLEEHEGGTRLTVHVEWLPRNWWCRPVLRSINRWLRNRYMRVLRELDDVSGDKLAMRYQPSSTSPKVDETRLRKAIQELAERGFSQSGIERLADHIRTASDEQLFRIRPKTLALDWDMGLGDLLSLLLQATRSGLLCISWDVMCPHCQGVRRESRSLGDLREFGRCDICDIDFQATLLESIEVTFKVLSEIRSVREVFYCSAEPAKKPHIIIQQHIAPGETLTKALALASGRYRLRPALGNNAPLLLDVVNAGGAESVIWNVGDQSSAPPLAIAPNANLTLVNSDIERISIVLELVGEDPTALRPADLFNLQKFRDLFSEESIASGLKLEVGHQTLLFTDIVGSTQLYSELGDSKAFNIVRSHFVALQEIISSRNGAIVKTIGDAVMAAFLDPEDALDAAVEIQKSFGLGEQHRVTLRVSIHRGLCLAVRLDSNIDYFGNAVNFTAKMQSVAGAGEIVFSNEFYSLPRIREKAREFGLDTAEKAFSFSSTGDKPVVLARFIAGK